jgi:hypothetical protein
MHECVQGKLVPWWPKLGRSTKQTMQTVHPGNTSHPLLPSQLFPRGRFTAIKRRNVLRNQVVSKESSCTSQSQWTEPWISWTSCIPIVSQHEVWQMMILFSRQQHTSSVCILHVTLVRVSALEANVLIAIKMHSSFYTTPVGQWNICNSWLSMDTAVELESTVHFDGLECSSM